MSSLTVDAFDPKLYDTAEKATVTAGVVRGVGKKVIWSGGTVKYLDSEGKTWKTFDEQEGIVLLPAGYFAQVPAGGELREIKSD